MISEIRIAYVVKEEFGEDGQKYGSQMYYLNINELPSWVANRLRKLVADKEKERVLAIMGGK